MPSTLTQANSVSSSQCEAPGPGRRGPSVGRVLLADPCRDTVETLTWLLELWGYDVLTAATGPAALTAARAGRPDAVLMEIGLPQLDGWQVARRLREEGGRPLPLLVAVSGYGSERERARSREAGFDGHLVKPVSPDVIRTWLATSLAVRRTVRHAAQK